MSTARGAGLAEQGGLADAGRAAEHEDRALRAAGAAQEIVEAIELVAPAVKRRRPRRHRPGAGRDVLGVHGGSWGLRGLVRAP